MIAQCMRPRARQPHGTQQATSWHRCRPHGTQVNTHDLRLPRLAKREEPNHRPKGNLTKDEPKREPNERIKREEPENEKRT